MRNSLHPMAGLLLLSLAAILPLRVASAPAPPLPPLPLWDGNTTIKVCASSYTPMIYCDTDTDPSLWTGYEVELFRRIADKLQWPMKQIKWKCLEWTDQDEALVAADGTCDVALGLSITGEYLQDGVVFSWPTYENGLIIAVNNEQKGASMWAFSQAFTWQVWVAVVCTAILIGIIIFAVDAWMYGAQYDRTKNKIFAGTDEGSLKRIAFMDYIWEAVMRPMQVRDQRPLSFPSNFIVLAFSFMMLVIVTVYTANTTANITTTRLQSTIRGAQDLPGKAVGSWSDYKSELSKYGVILTSSLPWENEADEGAMIESLVNGTVQAFVLDESFLVYKAASSCEIAIIGNKFEELNQAVAFPRGFNNTALLDAVNQALIKLREEGVISLLRDIYVNPPEASCKTALIGDSTQISMSMLSGLWIVLAVAIGIALAIAVIYKIHVRYTQKHVDKFGLQMTKKFRLSGNLFKEHEVVV